MVHQNFCASVGICRNLLGVNWLVANLNTCLVRFDGAFDGVTQTLVQSMHDALKTAVCVWSNCQFLE
jgi:hypothetical protein